MSYKIAVASSDAENVDWTFGSADYFFIYDVKDDGTYLENEKRVVSINSFESNSNNQCKAGKCDLSSNNVGGQSELELNSNMNGCGSGRNNAGGCAGHSDSIPKVELVSDCRCVICKKIGFKAQKAFEKKAITGFDVDCTIEEALNKITMYFNYTDNHKTLRGFVQSQHKSQ